jgi:Skp family chaperone for outer membrane proteins
MKKRNTDSSQAGPMEEGKPLLEEGKPLLVQRNEKTESMLKHRTTKRFIKILAIMMSVIAVLQVLDIKYKAELETLKKDHVDELNNAKSDNVYKAELKTLKKDHLEELNKAKSDNVYKAELETLKKELIELNNAKSDEVQSPSNYNLAKEQSFGFFDDIDDSNWKHLQTILAEMVDHQVPENPLQHLPTANGGWEGYFAWYQTVSSTLPTCSRIILKKWWQ